MSKRQTDEGKYCEECGADRPLRNIKMRDEGRKMLCADCFDQALGDDRVHPLDPRLPGENA